MDKIGVLKDQVVWEKYDLTQATTSNTARIK